MNIVPATTTEMAVAISVAVILAVGIGTVLMLRKRRADLLCRRFGGAEYTRAVNEGGGRHDGDAELDTRTARVQSVLVEPLATRDRARVGAPRRRVRPMFAFGAASRGDQVREFVQRTAGISVDCALVLAQYRGARDVAILPTKGEGDAQDLRQAVAHYLTCSRN